MMEKDTTQQKTIWIVNEYNFPDTEQTRQSNLCKRLIKRGYNALVISGSTRHTGGDNRITDNRLFEHVESSEAQGFLIKTSDYSSGYERVLVSLQFQRRLWALRDQLPKPDVIVSDFAGLFGNVFLKWKKRYGTKVIYDILDLWPEGFVDMGYLREGSPITKALYHMEHKSYREADGIIFSFQGGADYIRDKGWDKESGGDVDVSQVGYLNNGVDLVTVDRQRREFAFDDPDLDTDHFKVVYLGSISAFNGLDVLVETAKTLQDRGVEGVSILVYGRGTQEERLREMAEEYGLRNIKFKGPIEKRFAMSMLTKADVNVFTFANTDLLKYGVSPNKLFMYFASGKPVLSMIRPSYDLVEGRGAGLSVNNEPSSVADAIVRFMNMDDGEYQGYCDNARQLAEEYDYDKLVEVLIDMIEGDECR